MPLLLVMMASTLLAGLGTVLVLGTMTETAVAASYAQALEAFHAADGALEFAVRDLAEAAEWDPVVSGAATSTFVDGPPDGPRQVGRATIDLAQATADIAALWSAAAGGSLTFRLYAYGPFASLVAADSRVYICIWVAETEGTLHLVARAYGPTGAQRTVTAALARRPAEDAAAPGAVEVQSWEELP